MTETQSTRDGHDVPAMHGEAVGAGPEKTRMIAGLMIMAVGCVLVLAQAGVLTVHDNLWPRLWPLLIIGPGLGRLLTTYPDGKRRGGGLLAIGVCWLLIELRVWRALDVWPLLLVAFGLTIVWNAMTGAKHRAE